jgi:hypothetical protein
MRGRVRVVLCAAVLALQAFGCGGGEKTQPVTEAQFKTVSDYLVQKLVDKSFGAPERIKYVKSQLGTEHTKEGDKLRWYTSLAHCTFFEIDSKGGASNGSAHTDKCEKFAPK